MKMIFLVMSAAFLLLSLPVHAVAQDGSAMVNPETSSELPSMEMLEFLASFEDEDTGWVDPQDLMDMTDGDLDNDTMQESDNEQ